MNERLAIVEIAALEAAKLKNLETLNKLGGRIGYGFSTYYFGNMSFNWEEDSESGRILVAANRQKFCKALGVLLEDVVVMKPVHGTNIELVGDLDRGKGAFDPNSAIGNTDGLITQTPGLVLALNPADCAPVIITNKDADFVALVHAGRDGTDQQITFKAVQKLQSLGFKDTTSFLVGVGPTICCYKQDFIQTVNPKAWEPFLEPEEPGQKLQFQWLSQSSRRCRVKASFGKLKVDILGFNIAQLKNSGIPAENIDALDYCTFCNGKMHRIFSHALSTKNKLYPNGRLISVAWLNS